MGVWSFKCYYSGMPTDFNDDTPFDSVYIPMGGDGVSNVARNTSEIVVATRSTNPKVVAQDVAHIAGKDAQLSQYYAREHTYSGADIVATILVPNEKTDLVIGELQTISYSIHRESAPVRVLGSVNPAGFVRGPRTIAGSLIFTQFNEYAFYRLRQYKEMAIQNLYPLADMLPPFDIILTFANEFGRTSKMKIFGVTIIDEGATMSIDDMVTEQTYTYMARGIQPLTDNTPNQLGTQTAEIAGDVKRQSNVIVFRGA